MRKIFLSIMVSADGYAVDRNGGLDWIEVDDPELERHMVTDVLETIDVQVFGRRAYDLLSDFWLEAEANPVSEAQSAQAKLVNSIPKLVLTHSDDRLSWGPSSRLDEDITAQLQALKRQPGKDIAVFAGPETARVFTELDVIDEFRIMIYPVLLGGGSSPFRLPTDRLDLRLAEVTTFARSGVVIHRYHRA